MMCKQLTDDEITQIHASYPALTVWEEGRLLKGLLQFKACYPDIKGNELEEIQDEYEVAIKFEKNNVPHVWEIGGRLQRRARDLKRSIISMHVYPHNHEACLGTPFHIRKIMRKDPTIDGAFRNLIVRYFYYHAYLEKHGREPLPGLGHGCEGYFQGYSRDIGPDAFWECVPWGMPREFWKKIEHLEKLAESDWPCLCLQRRAQNCSCGAVEGFDTLIDDMRCKKLGSGFAHHKCRLAYLSFMKGHGISLKTHKK